MKDLASHASVFELVMGLPGSSIAESLNDSSFDHIEDIMPQFTMHSSACLMRNYGKILIPTRDSVMMKYLMSGFVNSGYSCMFIGESRIGKSLTIENFLHGGATSIVGGGNNTAGSNSTGAVAVPEIIKHPQDYLNCPSHMYQMTQFRFTYHTKPRNL